MKEQDPDPKEAAKDMLKLFETDERGILDRRDVIRLFETDFPGFIYQNKNGNRAIDKRVLKEFKKLRESLNIKLNYYRGGDYWKKE